MNEKLSAAFVVRESPRFDMKKLITALCATMVVCSVVAAGAIAHSSSHKGYWNGPWHGWTHGNAYVAVLTPTTVGPTGSTGATGSTGETSATGATGATGVSGVANARQNKRHFKLKVGLGGLTPSATYTIGLYQDADGLGCASTSNTLLTPPGAATVVATDGGYARAKLHVKRSVFQLDLTKTYYVQVNDAAGASVACGELVKPKKANHGHGKEKSEGHGHGKKKGHS
jgi:hypothetical protein